MYDVFRATASSAFDINIIVVNNLYYNVIKHLWVFTLAN